MKRRLLSATTVCLITLLAAPTSLPAQDVKRVVKILKTKPPAAKKAANAKPRAGTASGNGSVVTGGAAGGNAAAASGTPVPLFHLRDGGKVAGRPAMREIRVKTRYGILVVPIDELKRVRFATRVDPELAKRIDGLVVELGGDDFDQREDAMEALRKIGVPALGATLSRSGSPNVPPP